MIRQLHRAAVLAAAGLVAAAALPAGSASADDCAAGYVCFYTGADYTGTMTSYGNPETHICGGIPRAPALSVINNDDDAWTLYTGDFLRCRGDSVTVGAGERATGFSGMYSWK